MVQSIKYEKELREIKQSFRLMMNGAASKSMRDKGLNYGINWGIPLTVLKQMAVGYGKNSRLAIELWKENIRECKILATMIMPPSYMDADITELWVSQIPNQEIAEMLAFNLFQYIENAKDFAFKWIASDNDVIQVCGYHTLSRLFIRQCTLSVRELNELMDQAQTALVDDNMAVRHAAINMLSRLSATDENCHNILKSAFKSFDLDVF